LFRSPGLLCSMRAPKRKFCPSAAPQGPSSRVGTTRRNRAAPDTRPSFTNDANDGARRKGWACRGLPLTWQRDVIQFARIVGCGRFAEPAEHGSHAVGHLGTGATLIRIGRGVRAIIARPARPWAALQPSPAALAVAASQACFPLQPLVAESVITSSCHETCSPARRQPRLTYATYVRPPAPATTRKPEPGAGWQALLTGAQRLDELLLIHG
jgi:hypothetical protein